MDNPSPFVSVLCCLDCFDVESAVYCSVSSNYPFLSLPDCFVSGVIPIVASAWRSRCRVA